MAAFIERLEAVNPKAQVVLTVSPCRSWQRPSRARTCSPPPPIPSPCCGVAAETLRLRYPHVHYFPSYEIITGTFNRGRYFAPDLRSVTEEGVAHVMRLFLSHAAGVEVERVPAAAPAAATDETLSHSAAIVEVECDEVALDRQDGGTVAPPLGAARQWGAALLGRITGNSTSPR